MSCYSSAHVPAHHLPSTALCWAIKFAHDLHVAVKRLVFTYMARLSHSTALTSHSGPKNGFRGAGT